MAALAGHSPARGFEGSRAGVSPGGEGLSEGHQPRRSLGFLLITLLPRCLHAGDCGFGFVSYTRSRPRLGLAARSRVATHPGVRGFCQWASEPTGRQAAESPSRRAAERASARNSSSPRPHRPQGPLQDAPRECEVRTAPCPGFRLLSSPTHSHAWPFAVARATQVSVDATATTPGAVEELPLSRDLITRPPRASPRRP